MKKQDLFAADRAESPGFSAIFISISLILYPATLLSVPKINGLIFALFALTGLALLFIQRHKSTRLNRDEAWFYLAVAFFFFTTLLITINGGFVYKVLGKYIHLLLVIPVYIYLRHFGVKLFSVWYGLVIGSIASAGVAAYDVWVLHIPRAQGFNNAIIFGNLALVMGCMSMAGFGWFIKQRAGWQAIIPVFALMCGLLASVLSGTRGGWVAVPFLIPVLFWYVKSHFSLKQKIVIVLAISVLLCGVYVIPQTGVSKQITRTISSVQKFNDKTASNKTVTSVSARLDMWQASWKMFIDNPVLGVGWGHYAEHAKEQVDQGLFNQKAIVFDHPHSEYFSALANGGSLGFLALMQLFLIFAWLFVKYIRQGKTADTRRLALAGLVLVVSFMAFGLTEPMLYRSRSVGFFAFYLAVFLAAIYQENNKVVSR